MKKRWMIILVAVLVILLTVALVFIFNGRRDSKSQPVLFSMNFENEAAFFGWHVGGPGGDYQWLTNVKDGKYYFEFPSGFVESQDFDYSDIEISVDTEFLSKQKMDVSVACRLQPGASGRYTFVISNDQRWKILKSLPASEETLAEGWSDLIQLDKNHLAVRCVGETLTLLVNGKELGSAQDGTLKSGSLNLGYNSSNAGSGTFDNLVITDWSK